MTSISELGIKVDSTDAVQASTDLDKLTAAGDRAEKSTNALGETSEQSKARILELAKAAVAAREAQQNLSNTATGLSEAQQGLITSTVGSAQAQAQASAAQRETVVSTDRLAVSSAKANSVTSAQQAQLQQLLEQIDPTTKALNRLDEQERRLAEQKRLGLDPEVFSTYQAKIQQARESHARLDDSLTRTGNTAKQTAAALRGVPAQFTDIAVSLQGGQAPLTVLLQQGGQLKDMFGGILPAAKALGGYILGLVNPFTVAAAAVAGLTYAYASGSNEAIEYQKALILSGNAAGTNADSLGNMARQVSATIGTTGAAAEVLTKLAASGKIASGSFEGVTSAALEMEKATGRSVEETIAEFVKIGKDPVGAAKELNDQYNFLTASTYAQIVALKSQGDTIGAAKLLTDTYVDTIKNRSAEVTENLSIWERGWKSLKGEISATASAVKDIGRDEALASQITRAQQRVAAAQSAVNYMPSDTDAQTKLVNSKLELDFLTQQKNTQDAIAKAQGLNVQIQREGIDASTRLKAISDSNLTNEEKRNKLIKEYKRDVEALRKANANDPMVQPAVVEKTIQNIREKNKDPKGATTPVDLSSFNDSKNQLNAVLSYYKSADKELEAAQKAGIISQESYTAQRVALLQQQASEVKSSYEAEIAALESAKGKASTSAAQRIQLDQKIADARANMVKAQQESESELAVIATNEQGRLKKQELAIKSYTDALDQQNTALQRAGSRAAQGVGQSDRQNAINGDLNGISDRANQQRLDLARDKADASRNMSAEEYQAKLEAINRSERDLTQTTLSNYDEMSVAQGDWRNGATSAFYNYLDSARDVAGQTKSLFSNAFTGMEDALVNFVMTGKLSFSDLAKSIIADMARIEIRKASSSALSSLFGLASSAAGAYFGGGAAAAGSGSFGASIGTAITANAKGGVYDSPSLSSFSNQVHDKPQMFAFAKGAAIFAEAGPEAIMPLKRSADGSLGVSMIGGSTSSQSGDSGAASVSVGGVTQHITVQGNADEATLMKIQEAARRGAEGGYQLMLKDLKTNGPALQLIKRR